MNAPRTEPHEDPDLRRKVFETVTFNEALAVMRSRSGRPWTKAAAEILIEGLRPVDHDIAGEVVLRRVTVTAWPMRPA